MNSPVYFDCEQPPIIWQYPSSLHVFRLYLSRVFIESGTVGLFPITELMDVLLRQFDKVDGAEHLFVLFDICLQCFDYALGVAWTDDDP